MDEDLVFAACFLGVIVVLPFAVTFAILSSVAYSRTKAWDRARNQRSIALESEHTKLVSHDESHEDEFYDTEDEEEHHKQKAEEDAERFLTFNQKFRKELGKMWRGNGGVNVAAKQKEREDRRKLAKAVVKEMLRVERRKARPMASTDNEEKSLADRKL